MKHSVTVIGVNYYPEDTATGLYTTQMVEYLRKSGYDMTVVTGFPYYPQWEISSDYSRRSRFVKERINGVNIFRYKQYVPKQPSFFKRILHLLDFTIGNFFNIKKINKTDLVICVVPFTSSILLGAILAKRTRAKLWVHIQDFEFDAAIESGMIDLKGVKGLVFKGLFALEKKLFSKSDVISTISHGMLEKLKTKTTGDTYLFPNWVNSNEIDPNIAVKHDYLNSKKFKILYSGNIGSKQNWDFFIEVVENLRNDASVEFVVVGDGAQRKVLSEKLIGFTNCKLYDPVQYEFLPDLLCSADLHILFQKSDIIDTVMPSKLLGMMSSAVPSIVTGNLKSEVAKVFSESKGGFFYESNDLESVLDAINNLKSDQSLSNSTGLNAREYVAGKFSYNEVLKSFEEKINQTLS